MNPKKILFFDIDHTLYDPVKRHVPQDTIDAFNQLSKNNDIILAIATGRASYMLSVIDCLKPTIDTYITINGHIITHKDTIIKKTPMPIHDVRIISNLFDAHKLTYGFIGEHHQSINRLTKYARTMFTQANMPQPIEDPTFASYNDVYQVWAFATDKETTDIKPYLKAYRLTPWLSDGFDILLENQSKKNAIKTVLDYFNIDKNNAYVIGDGDNDIDMLTYIKHSACMATGPDHVKKVASYVTTAVNDGGIVKALKHFNLL
ncbi:MAG: Cof-type HAD-IIB family hydrolase [Bacillota bacterium]